MSEKTIVESNLTQRESNLTMREGWEDGNTDSFSLRNFREYEIVEQLPAQGGEADIYVISKDGKRFILKFYRFGIDPNLDALKKIKEITNKNQKNFINIIEIGKEDKRFFEIMEEASFGNLNKLIESKELNVANIYSLIESINASLEILHKNNILHRDLKPSNILVKNKTPFEFALADFGISSVLEDGFSKKLTSKKGTELYWAPEASAGVIRKESDYFSLGVIVLEALLGKHPLAGLNEQLIIATMRTKGIVVPEDIDSNLKTLIKGLLTRDPEKRWSYKEIVRWLKGEKDIAIHYENISSTQEYMKPLTYEGEKFSSIEELVNYYISKENGWETLKKLVLRRNISTWLQNNDKHDESNKLDDIIEDSKDSDMNLVQFLASFIPEMEFNIFGKAINLNNLNIYLGKYLRREASEVENKIVDLFLSGKLYEYLEQFSKLSSNYDNNLLIAREILTYSKKVSNTTDRVKLIQEIFNIYMNKQQYILPYNSVYDEKGNREFFYENYIFSLKRVEYERILKNYLVPDSFYDLDKKYNLDILKAIKDNTISYIQKKIDRNLFLPQRYRTIESLNLHDYMDLSKFLQNNRNTLVGKEQIYYLLNEYILPKDIRKTEPETLEELKKLIEIKDNLITKDRYSKLKNEFILFEELKNLENYVYNEYIKIINYGQNLINKLEYENLKNENILPLELKNLDKYLSIDDYEQLRKKLVAIKDKLISISEYKGIKNEFILFKELNSLEELPLIEYDRAVSYKESLLRKSVYEYLRNNYVLPLELSKLDEELPCNQYLELKDKLLSIKEKLISISEYEVIKEKFVLFKEFKDLTNTSTENYLICVANKGTMVEKVSFDSLKNNCVLPLGLSKLDEELPCNQYLELKDKLLSIKDKLLSISLYQEIKEKYVLFKELNDLSSANTETYLDSISSLDALIEKTMYEEYINECVMPSDFIDLDKYTRRYYITKLQSFFNNKKLFITKTEYEEVLSQYAMPLDFKNLIREDIEEYIKLIEVYIENKKLFLTKSRYKKLSETYLLPKELLENKTIYEHISAVKAIGDAYIQKKYLKKFKLDYLQLMNIDEYRDLVRLINVDEYLHLVQLINNKKIKMKKKYFLLVLLIIGITTSVVYRPIVNSIISNDTAKSINRIKFLIKIGADIKGEYGKTALIYASDRNDIEVIKLLVEKGADVNAQNNYGETALMYASEEVDNKEIVEFLLKNGADVNAQNNYGETALMYASKEVDNKEIVDLLVKNGADVNAQTNYGETALMYASSKGQKEIVELLLKNGADVNAKNQNGTTALLYASEEVDNKEIVDLLVKNGADVNAQNSFGVTALLYASSKGQKEIVELLLKNGADVNAKNENGTTALKYASINGNKEIVELLLKKGADVNNKDNNGKTALMLASTNGHEEIVSLLKQHGAIE